MSPQYTCPSLHGRHVSAYFSVKSLKGCLSIWITGALRRVSNTTHCSVSVGTEMTPIAVSSRRFTGYKYSFCQAPTSILHFFTLSPRVFSPSPHLFIIEDKRGTNRSHSSESGSSSLSSDASKTLSSSSKSLPPPVSPLNVG
jgi:hypothetical protein